MDEWEHAQKVDYEQLSFKCRKCHEYGHFVKNCPKAVQESLEKTHEEGWQLAKKGRKTVLATHETKDPQVENEKVAKQGESEAITNNKFNPLTVEEGEIIVNEETIDEVYLINTTI